MLTHMIVNNYIRIDQDERAAPLYRFTTIERLLNTLEQKRNILVAPRKWEDPYENALAMHIRFRRSDGATASYPLRYRAYGQCWTREKETDAFWRMYTPQGSGVRLQSTIQKLYKSLNKSVSEKIGEALALTSCFIGSVEYMTEKDITTRFNDSTWVKQNFCDQGTLGHVNSLLLKRTEFVPENEVRLLYLSPENNDYANGCYDYSIDSSSVITEVTFDPRMDDKLCSTYESKLRSYGFTKQINKSGLYRVPDIKVCC